LLDNYYYFVCSYDGMIGREALTVIDHNHNVGRKQVALIKVDHFDIKNKCTPSGSNQAGCATHQD
jgi:hypothetical protein